MSKSFFPYEQNKVKRRAAAITHEPLYSAGDLAERWQLHPNTIHKHAATGVIPNPVKIGGRMRWRYSEIIQFENSSKLAPRKDKAEDDE
jgi:predicted DNA-binding transcriptional regulator AlpA